MTQVQQDAQAYNDDVIDPTLKASVAYLDRLSRATGDGQYSKLGQEMSASVATLPTWAAGRSSGAFNALSDEEGKNKMGFSATMVDPAVTRKIADAQSASLRLASSADNSDARASARLAATSLSVLLRHLHPDTYDQAVLTPAVQRYIK